MPADLELHASHRLDVSNALLHWEALVQHMQPHNGCPGRHSDQKANPQSPHIVDTDIQNPEKKEPRPCTTLEHRTHNFLAFLTQQEGYVHFSEHVICLPDCAIA